MSDFMAQCVESYFTLAGKPATCLSKVATPFLDESVVPARRTTEGSFGSQDLQGIDEGALCGPRCAAGLIESDLHDGTKGNEVGRRLRPPTPQVYVLH